MKRFLPLTTTKATRTISNSKTSSSSNKKSSKRCKLLLSRNTGLLLIVTFIIYFVRDINNDMINSSGADPMSIFLGRRRWDDDDHNNNSSITDDKNHDNHHHEDDEEDTSNHHQHQQQQGDNYHSTPQEQSAAASASSVVVAADPSSLQLETCKTKYGHRCVGLIVVQNINTTFCSAAKVASTSIRSFFMEAAGGSVVAPPDAKYPVHQANWTKLTHVSTEMQNALVTMMTDETVIHNNSTSTNTSSSRDLVLQVSKESLLVRQRQQPKQQWTQVFFIRPVVERFVSGYLDKIVNDCSRKVDDSVLYRSRFVPLGFSCEKHTDLEEFIHFMQQNLYVDGHFAPQTFCCVPQHHPYSDVIVVDEDLNKKLEELSTKILGIGHRVGPPPESARAHKTGSKSKIVTLFKGRGDLLQKVLDMYKDDCLYMPSVCNVTDLMRQIE